MTGTTLGLLLSLSTALLAAVRGDCPSGVASADDCLQKTAFSQLRQGDPSYYCEQGSILAAKAQNCLRDCEYSEDNSYLQARKNEINSFCSQMNPGCPAVCDTYINQTRCYDSYGGLDAVISSIIDQFERKEPNINCNKLYWGRYCQKTQNCSVNQNLDMQLIQDKKIVTLGLAICGSETLKDALNYLEVTEGCGSAIDSAIVSQCNISCEMADAVDGSVICSLLQRQVQCFQKYIVNCTASERRYVLPRLNTYAIANRYLGCSIKYNGITVRAPGEDKEYSSLINQCMFSNTIEQALTYERLYPLFNRNTPSVGFCQTKGDSDNQITNCRNSYRSVATPQANLLTRAQDLMYDLNAKFLPEIGGFPLDNFGMVNIYNNTPDNCANSLQWTNMLCVPTSDRPVTTVTGSTTTAASTTSFSRTTPTAGQGYTPSKRPNSDGNQGENFQLNNSGMVMPAVFLIITSLLGSLLQY